MPQSDRDARTWATLCTAHDKELNQGVDLLEPKALMRVWIKAQGGSAAAAKRVLGK